MLIEKTLEDRIYNFCKNNNKEGDEGIREFSSQLASAIIDTIKSATITTPITEGSKMSASGYPVIIAIPLNTTIE